MQEGAPCTFWYMQNPEEGTGSPKTGVIVNCEPPYGC